MASQWGVVEPFPIYLVKSRYFLYDANVVSHVRASHRMCGCLTGTLPQIPQQNVFLGLPLELMTEEAALLVEKGAGYIVNDIQAHAQGLKSMLEADKTAYLEAREAESIREMQALQKAAEERRKAFRTPKPASLKDNDGEEEETREEGKIGDGEEDKVRATVFETDTAKTKPSNAVDPAPSSTLRYYPVPATSEALYHALPTPPGPSEARVLEPAPSETSYPLYKHLHEHNYFLSPGLRFGCQFMAYPGDPLRFHSHFVVTGLGWDEEIEMRDVVGGGRLGTGVKKAWMVGGENKDKPGEVRTFCVEWGGF
ncbi:uncharacterized protein H6S33_003625 [Morchella sextelata]|uniref:uncharacterized protein n=1 Tax=Morchella sextelata TaxID=1174677 RepID=UPI001D044CE3|nr:uncharacterized protein H6S33_003625 [Morchella sextelata]KAH0606791.1 hypothetical protein H6S33_003625 [Morchella sextelata]